MVFLSVTKKNEAISFMGEMDANVENLIKPDSEEQIFPVSLILWFPDFT